MLFILIRMSLLTIICVGIVLVMRKTQMKHKRAGEILLIIFCTMLITAASMFPLENLVFNYKTPEDVFNYTKIGEIKGIIQGQDSCLVVYSTKSNNGGFYVIPKTDKGYKIPNYFETSKVYKRFDENALFEIYNVNGTQDYYVFGAVTLEENDNDIKLYRGDAEVESSFIRVDKTSFIYFNIPYFSEELYLKINGKEVVIIK